MPTSCCVVGCTVRHGVKYEGTLYSLFRIPKINTARRRQWLIKIKRKDFKPTSASRVCGRHFESGHPMNNPSDVDYVPTLHMRGEPIQELKSTKRSMRAAKRIEAQHLRYVAQVISYITLE